MTPTVKIKIYYKDGNYEEYKTQGYTIIDELLLIEQGLEWIGIKLEEVDNYEIEVIKEK